MERNAQGLDEGRRTADAFIYASTRSDSHPRMLWLIAIYTYSMAVLRIVELV